MIGPVLTDAQFFGEIIDYSMPGLEMLQDAVKDQDYALCRKLFASCVRKDLEDKEDLFFSIPYDFPPNEFVLPGERVEDAVDRIKKNRFVSVGIPYQFEDTVDWFFDPTNNHLQEWTWQFNRHHEWKLLANHYRETGDETSAEKIVNLFESWVKQAIVPGDNVQGNETICWRTIEVGTRMGVDRPYVLFCIYKSVYFTDDILVDWYKSVWEHGHRLHINHRSGNWLIIEMNGLAYTGIVYSQFKCSKEWINYAEQMLSKQMERQIYPDGFQYELSTGYQGTVINSYMRFVKIADAFHMEVPYRLLKCIENMLDVYIRIMKPNGEIPDLNDGTSAQASQPIERYLPYFKHNENMQWLCRGRTGDGVPGYMSTALEYAGIMIMRNGWKEDSTWALFDAAPFGAGHQHEDKLNLLIYAKGRSIITECGNYAYDDSEMRKYALSTRSHNTVRINGKDQNRRSGYKWNEQDIQKKADMYYRIESEFDYVKSKYDEGYGEEKVGGVTHERSVIFLKKPDFDMEPYFVVVDRMYSMKENHYEILWHVDAADVSVKNMQAKADFLHIFTSLSNVKTSGVDIICGQQYPEWQGWKRGEAFTSYTSQPVIRYHASGLSKRIVTVIYPDDNCPIAAVEAGDDVNETLINIVLKSGERIQLDEKIIKE